MPLSEEQLKQAMDSYGNLRHEIEGMKANLKTVIDGIIDKYPEIRKEIEEAKEELKINLEKAEKIEKKQKEVLKDMIDSFSRDAVIKDKLEIKSSLVKVSLEKEVTYDPAGMDGYALDNPKVLMFRKEKISNTIRLNNM